MGVTNVKDNCNLSFCDYERKIFREQNLSDVTTPEATHFKTIQSVVLAAVHSFSFALFVLLAVLSVLIF